jgi:hypothetical protein
MRFYCTICDIEFEDLNGLYVHRKVTHSLLWKIEILQTLEFFFFPWKMKLKGNVNMPRCSYCQSDNVKELPDQKTCYFLEEKVSPKNYVEVIVYFCRSCGGIFGREKDIIVTRIAGMNSKIKEKS